MEQRNTYFDLLRGSVIFLVVFGHSIQFGSGAIYLDNEEFFENIIFRMIYCFHMPIFMMISGYFFSYSIRKYTVFQLIKGRITHLLLPIFLWGTLEYLFLKLKDGLLTTSFREWGHHMMYGFWFLWAIFYASMIITIVKCFFGDSLLVYFLGWLIFFITPDICNFQLYKFMYPYFVCSYLIGKHQKYLSEKLKGRVALIACVTGMMTMALFPFFHYDAYIYTTGYQILNRILPIRQLGIDIFRMIIGFSGSLFWTSLLYLIYKRTKVENIIIRMVSKLGCMAMGVYIVSGYLFQYGLKVLTKNFTQNYLVNLLETVLVLGISVVCTRELMRFEITNRLFLGGKRKQ